MPPGIGYEGETNRAPLELGMKGNPNGFHKGLATHAILQKEKSSKEEIKLGWYWRMGMQTKRWILSADPRTP